MKARNAVRIGAVAALVAGFVAVQQAPAEAKTTRGPGTAAFEDRKVVQLTHAGAERGKGGLALHMTSKDAVVAGNLAVATSSCDGCHATAISFQVLVADKTPTSLDVGNVAYADNEGCAFCEADAFAYQFVLAFDGDAQITGAGRLKLARIDWALGRLARSGSSAEEIQAAADGYAAQVVDVLSSELRVRPVVRKGVQKHHGHDPKSVARPPDALAP
ncbi:MAG: hypothetical protein ABJA74_00110 [Lapillicoccus sp.]